MAQASCLRLKNVISYKLFCRTYRLSPRSKVKHPNRSSFSIFSHGGTEARRIILFFVDVVDVVDIVDVVDVVDLLYEILANIPAGVE